ncbi:hypothetical protein [Mesorhizobium argentiipisi]|uniref:Uncharacterized protein n=1 Tax=Mesorhizobium argentiipisi TaxID=3015175 RepID=A0ABU8KLT9_9HYPH
MPGTDAQAASLAGRLLGHWCRVHGSIAYSGCAGCIASAAGVPDLPAPFYMVHQVEEHAGDRFGKFANENALAILLHLPIVAVVTVRYRSVVVTSQHLRQRHQS